MPTGQQYATNVPQTQLTSSINATATSISVASATGWPAPPFTATIDLGAASQEPVDVTAVVGTTFTITRSVDGTSAFAHSNGATVTHTDIGRDYRESRSHIDASASPDATGHAVHGLNNASSVVGTTDTQTLTNKSLTSPSFTGNVGMGPGSWLGTGALTDASLAFSGISGANVQNGRLAGTTTAGPPIAGTFLAGDIVFDQLGNQWYCTTGGVPGTWVSTSGSALANLVTFSGSTNSTTVTLPAWASQFNNMTVRMAGNSAFAGVGEFINLRFNGDSAAHYEWQYTGWNNNGAASTGQGATVSMIAAGTIGGAAAQGHLIIEVPMFRATLTSAFRTVTFNSTSAGSLAAATTNLSIFGGGTWSSNAAITSFTILTGSASNISANSTLSVLLSK